MKSVCLIETDIIYFKSLTPVKACQWVA